MARGYAQSGSEINQYRIKRLGESPPITEGNDEKNPMPIISRGGMFKTASENWDINKPPFNNPKESGKIYLSGYALDKILKNNKAPTMDYKEAVEKKIGAYDYAARTVGDGKFMTKDQAVALYGLLGQAKNKGDAIAVPLSVFIAHNKAASKPIKDGPFLGDPPEGGFWPVGQYSTPHSDTRQRQMGQGKEKPSNSSIKANELKQQREEAERARNWKPEPELGYPEGGAEAYYARQTRDYSVFRQGRWMIAD